MKRPGTASDPKNDSQIRNQELDGEDASEANGGEGHRLLYRYS
eukprot:COSAG05_NODE_505_length_9196_cov_3.893591_5_plen_43_part_00